MLRAIATLWALASAAALSAQTQPSVAVSLDSPGRANSPQLFGIFFEDLNYAADGGLYPELIQNRSFEYSATEQSSWGPFFAWELTKRGDGDGHLGLGNVRPIHHHNPHYLLLTVLRPGDGVGVVNRGFDQIPVEAGKSYEASFWTYQTYMGRKWTEGADQSKPMPVTLRLVDDAGVLAEAKVSVSGRAWTKHAALLKPARTATHARFELLAHEQGEIAVDMVSLFPTETFLGRPNGLRADLAQAIADLRPRFMRFPGGCLVHGSGVHAYYDWKASVGPLEQRRAARNLWGYHQTMGLGYFEYFQFCADLGAVPVPVVSAGVCCQHAGHTPHRGQEGLPLEEMPAYIQDILDLIEWANGPADSRWGAVRAAAGRREPFGLKYLGVGNEDAITPAFEERFRMIHDVLKARHPEIVVIGTAGPFPDGEDFDKGWAFARQLRLAMVDEHYYRPPQWFWDNLQRYDGYDRGGAKVYVGEYAAHDDRRRNTLRSALAEAAFLTSLERNGDVVQLASYAPLLARRGHTQWHPDMIYFDATRVFPSLNHTMHRLVANNTGEEYLPTAVAAAGGRLAASTVRERASGDVIVKMVNGDETARQVRLKFTGGRWPAKVRRTVFGGAAADVVNEDGQPPAVAPTTDAVELPEESDYELPPNSLTILRLTGR